MADERFFTNVGPFTLGQLAEIAGGNLAEGSNPQMIINDVGALDTAGHDCISFLDNRKYIEVFTKSKAGACIIRPDMAEFAPSGMSLILIDNPYKAYAKVATAFYPFEKSSGVISPKAIIDETAEIGEGTQIDSGAVIAEGVTIGKSCRICANAVIGKNVTIGDECIVGACASISHAIIGNRVYLYPGVRIGQDGFGFAMDKLGRVKVPQLGRVIIEDDVEIGANSAVDRGAGGDTVIGRGSMIDNLVQIAHNVKIGPSSVLIAQSGVAGSSSLGTGVILAGQAGIAGHLKIGHGARIAAQSGVMNDVPAGVEVCGSPAVNVKQFFRQVAVLAKLAGKKPNDGE